MFRTALRPLTVDRLLALAGLICLVTGLAGCDRELSDVPFHRKDYAQFPPSDLLADAVDDGWHTLARADKLPPGDPDLDTYFRLIDIERMPATRDSARTVFAELWRNHPHSLVLHQMSTTYFRAVRETLGAEILADSTLLDPATARGCYLLSLQTQDSSERLAKLDAAYELRSQLTPAEQTWVEYRRLFWHGFYEPSEKIVEDYLAFLPRAREMHPLLETMVWCDLAFVLARCEQLPDALQARLLSANLASRFGCLYLEHMASIWVADDLTSLEENRLALQVLDECIARAERTGIKDDLFSIMIDAAAIHAGWGHRERALELDRKVLALAVAEGDSACVVRALVNVSTFFRKTLQIDSTRVYLNRAERWSRCFRRPEDKARLLLYHCGSYEHFGDYATVDSLLAKIDTLLSSGAPVNIRASRLLQSITLGRATGRPAIAYAAIKKLRELQPEITDLSIDGSLITRVESAIAFFLGWQGEYALAYQALASARLAAQEHGNERDLWQVEQRACEIEIWSDDLASAWESADLCLDIAQNYKESELIAGSRVLMGRLHLIQGDYEQALNLFALASDTTNGFPGYRNMLSCHLYTGVAYSRQQRYDLARAAFERAHAAYGEQAPADIEARLLLETSRAARIEGDAREAELELTHALGILRDARYHPDLPELRVFHADLEREITEDLIALYLGHPGLVGRGREAAKTLQLAEFCRLHKVDLGARDDLDTTTSPIPVKRLDLETGSPLVAFFVGHDHSFRWIVTRDTTIVAGLPGRDGLKQLLAPVLADFKSPTSTVNPIALEKLSRLLLGPIATYWQSGGTLRIVPDDLLQSAPWYGLELADSSAGSVSLLQHGVFVEATSALPQTTASTTRNASGTRLSRRLLSIGVDASLSDEDVDKTRLRFAEKEAREVAEAWAPRPVQLALGQDASWSELKKLDWSRFAAIHLATHTTIYQGQAGQSILRLGTGPEAVPLSLTEIRALDLDADLVFLSCCEAARRVATSGATATFAQAFLAAGAQSVIAPSIRIEDEAARYLADRFYRHWLTGQTKSSALRQALLDLSQARTEWSHPQYWAFYRLIEH